MNLKDKIVCVYDVSGQYISIAQELSKSFGRTLYCTNWQQAFPKYNTFCVGMNVQGIERVDNIWKDFDDIDLFVFPDLYMGDMQDWLRSKGKLVFGAGSGENMEIYRDEFYDFQKELKLPVNGYEVIKGITKLRKYLKGKENKWVKSNLVRGMGETFNYKNSRLSESRLDEMQHTFGAYKEEAVFIVCDPIDNAVEIGHDTFVIDGEHPNKVLVGIEIKDAGYVGYVQQYDKIHPTLKNIDDKFKDYFKEHKYRGLMSTEVRWDGKKGYLGDITLRTPQPPGDLQTLIFDNYAEIVWEVANGNIPEIKAENKFGAQIVIHSSWATNEPQAVYFPDKFKDNIKLKSLMYKDDTAYYVPIDGFSMEEIGSVVATGKTMKEAIEKAKEIAKEVEGDSIEINGDALDEATAEIDKLKKMGITLF